MDTSSKLGIKTKGKLGIFGYRGQDWTVCNKYQQQEVGKKPLLCSLQEMGEYKDGEKTYRSVKVGMAVMKHENEVRDMEEVISENMNNQPDSDVSVIEDDGILEFKDIDSNILYPFIIFNHEQLILTVNMFRKLVVLAFIGHD